MTMVRSYEASLELDESLVELKRLLGELEATDKEEGKAKASIASCRESLTTREAELLMDGVEGKNENERKAALRIKTENDVHYLNITLELHGHESDLSAIQVDSAALRREWQYHRIKLEVGIAKMTFLGKGGQGDY